MGSTTSNYAFRYPTKDDTRFSYADIKNLADDVDAHLLARARGQGSIASPIHKLLSQQQNVKTGTLLAETIPWELALVSANARNSAAAGTQATSQRLTLMAIYLEKGQIVTGFQKYCTSAYNSFVHMTLSLWSYDGTTFTCLTTTSDLNTGTGFRGLLGMGANNYTVPITGIYYVGFMFNGTAGSGTDLMFTDAGGITATAGDFTGGKVNMGFSNTNWARVVGIPGVTNTAISDTRLFSAGAPVTNYPWVAVIGTIL